MEANKTGIYETVLVQIEVKGEKQGKEGNWPFYLMRDERTRLPFGFQSPAQTLSAHSVIR